MRKDDEYTQLFGRMWALLLTEDGECWELWEVPEDIEQPWAKLDMGAD